MRFALLIWAAALGLTNAHASPNPRRRRDGTRNATLSETKKFIVEVEQVREKLRLLLKILR